MNAFVERVRARIEQWNPPQEQKDRLRRIAFVAYTVLATLFFIWLFLPREAILAAVTAKVSAAAGRNVTAKDVSLSGLSGVTLEGLSVERDSGPAIEVDEQSIRVGLLSALIGRTNLWSRSEVGEGWMEAEFKRSKDRIRFEAALEAFDLTRLLAAPAKDKFGLEGKAKGKLFYETPGTESSALNAVLDRLKDPSGATGEVKLTLQEGVVQGINLGAIPVPPIHFTEVRADMAVKEGRLEITSFEVRGGDADIDAGGFINLRTPLLTSPINIKLKVTPYGEFKQKYAIAFTQLRSEPGGSYAATIQGSLGAPQVGR
ncbi:MAG: type II secretion system protein GspN [Bdellovibrionota bacterium]